MKALFIGGTGTISTSITRLCVQQGWELYLLNRGNRPDAVPEGAKVIVGDVSNVQDVRTKLEGMHFDVVADFIAYAKADVQRDVELFREKTNQYIFISSASGYQKPLSSLPITESTPMANPYWKYSQDKILCEDALMKEYRESGFPITIVRPSHTYALRSIPVALHGKNGSFSVVERIRTGRKVIVPGDGLTHWTLTHADDFAKAFSALMGNVHAIGETYHITGDECLTWNQIYEVIGQALGVKPKITHIASDVLASLCLDYRGSLLGDKSNNAIFDNKKIKRAVPGFCSTIRFDQGVRQALEYIYSHPDAMRADPDFDDWCDAVIEQYESVVFRLPPFQLG